MATGEACAREHAREKVREREVQREKACATENGTMATGERTPLPALWVRAISEMRDCTISSVDSIDVDNFSLTLPLPYNTQIHTHTCMYT